MLRLSFAILLLGVVVYGQTTLKPSSTRAVTKRQTTPKPKPAPPLKCKFFDIGVKATSTLWNDDYANPATGKHMELRWKLESAIHQLYDDEKEFNAFNLINMKKDKDDTAIHFYLIFNKEGEFSKKIETAVAAGKIGSLAVDKKFLKKECYKEPKPAAAANYCPYPCSTMCMPSCNPGCCNGFPLNLPPPPTFSCAPACSTLPVCPASCPTACCRSKVKENQA